MWPPPLSHNIEMAFCVYESGKATDNPVGYMNKYNFGVLLRISLCQYFITCVMFQPFHSAVKCLLESGKRMLCMDTTSSQLSVT